MLWKMGLRLAPKSFHPSGAFWSYRMGCEQLEPPRRSSKGCLLHLSCAYFQEIAEELDMPFQVLQNVINRSSSKLIRMESQHVTGGILNFTEPDLKPVFFAAEDMFGKHLP